MAENLKQYRGAPQYRNAPGFSLGNSSINPQHLSMALQHMRYNRDFEVNESRYKDTKDDMAARLALSEATHALNERRTTSQINLDTQRVKTDQQRATSQTELNQQRIKASEARTRRDDATQVFDRQEQVVDMAAKAKLHQYTVDALDDEVQKRDSEAKERQYKTDLQERGHVNEIILNGLYDENGDERTPKEMNDYFNVIWPSLPRAMQNRISAIQSEGKDAIANVGQRLTPKERLEQLKDINAESTWKGLTPTQQQTYARLGLMKNIPGILKFVSDETDAIHRARQNGSTSREMSPRQIEALQEMRDDLAPGESKTAFGEILGKLGNTTSLDQQEVLLSKLGQVFSDSLVDIMTFREKPSVEQAEELGKPTADETKGGPDVMSQMLANTTLPPKTQPPSEDKKPKGYQTKAYTNVVDSYSQFMTEDEQTTQGRNEWEEVVDSVFSLGDKELKEVTEKSRRKWWRNEWSTSTGWENHPMEKQFRKVMKEYKDSFPEEMWQKLGKAVESRMKKHKRDYLGMTGSYEKREGGNWYAENLRRMEKGESVKPKETRFPRYWASHTPLVDFPYAKLYLGSGPPEESIKYRKHSDKVSWSIEPKPSSKQVSFENRLMKGVSKITRRPAKNYTETY